LRIITGKGIAAVRITSGVQTGEPLMYKPARLSRLKWISGAAA